PAKACLETERLRLSIYYVMTRLCRFRLNSQLTPTTKLSSAQRGSRAARRTASEWTTRLYRKHCRSGKQTINRQRTARLGQRLEHWARWMVARQIDTRTQV